ncbi:hypothetical protein C9374_004951 [Naegleria lovaniensis]|uniref:Guanylate cyclase domain-containing protein n=1 Tax=Naegleria lovaniensis TaxID=51637 RepID=A0AA88KIM6_NAELO|nr:uncharacterized protein C9374_004951 [Naegleria lovaniensis]KAG2382984.1 hypothetical protein C9374_004951 [Naegleria lovaniensis]
MSSSEIPSSPQGATSIEHHATFSFNNMAAMREDIVEGANSVVGGGQTAVHSALTGTSLTDGASATSSSTLSAFAVMNRLQTQLFALIVALQSSSKQSSIMFWILSFLFNIHAMWVSIFIPTLGGMKFGEYGEWIFTVANYPLTLSLNLVPYEGMIALVFIVCASLLLYIALLFTTYKRIINTRRFSDWFLQATRFFNFVILIACGTMTFILTSLVDCSTVTVGNEGNSSIELSRYDGKACYESPNVIFLAFSLIAFIILIPCVALSAMIYRNSHPLNKSLFTSMNNYAIMVLLVLNCVEIMTVFLIPNHMPHIRAIAHVLISVIWPLLFVNNLPYFRKAINSIFFGASCAKIGASIGAIITVFVNTQNSNNLGLYLMAMTLGLILFGFLIGFVGMQIFLTVVHRQVHKIVTENKENLSQVLQIFEKKKRWLIMYLHFSIIRPKKASDSEDVVLSLAKVIGANKNQAQQHTSLLLMSALIIAYTWQDGNSHSFAMYMFRRCMKMSNNVFARFQVHERSREVELDETSSSSALKCMTESKHVLDSLERFEDELRTLHIHFWKELLCDIPNDVKLEYINRRCADLNSHIEDTYHNLMRKYRNEKNIIRKYANFLETFRFDKETAQTLFAEANELEEEGSKYNFVSPTAHNKYMVNRRISVVSQRFEQQISSFEGDLNEEFNGVETKDYSKKDAVLKNSLRYLENSKGYYVFLVIFLLFSFFVLLTCVAVSLFGTVKTGTDVQYVYKMCKGSSVSVAILRELRFIQNLNKYYQNGFTIRNDKKLVVDLVTSSHKQHLVTYKSFMADIVEQAQKNQLNADAYAKLVNDSVSVLFPFTTARNSSKGEELVFTETYVKNSSMIEMSNYLLTGINKFIEWNIEDYNQTITDFNFMYLWRNRKNSRDAFETFCESIVASTEKFHATFVMSFAIVYFTIIMMYIVGFVIFLGAMLKLMISTKQVSKLFNSALSKNIIGKVYHDLRIKNDEDVKVHLPKSQLSAPRYIFLFMGVFTLLCCILSGAMMVVESNINYTGVSLTMNNIIHGTAVMRHVHRTNFKVGEYFSFLGSPPSFVNEPSLLKEEDLTNSSADVKTFLSYLFKEWNILIYGGGQFPPSVGKYKEIDDLVAGIKNCTQAASNNATNTVEMYTQRYCTGLEEMLTEYSKKVSIFDADSQNSAFTSNTASMFHNYMDVFFTGSILGEKIIDFMDLFVKYSAQPSVILTILFGIGCFVLMIVVFYGMLYQLEKHRLQLINMRMMLNYIPCDVIDSSEQLRNYILYSIIGSSNEKKTKKNQVQSADSDNANVKGVLNASVDGAILCTQDGTIEFVNSSTQKMFGFATKADVVGVSVVTLFDKEQSHLIQNSIKEMNKAQLDVTHSEVIESTCLRKNQTKFPVKINIFSVMFDNGIPMITLIIKDITAEKKQNVVLAEEKAKSDMLLKNILPEAVAERLKAGETFIAERFTDITCFFSDMVGFTKMSSSMNPSQLVGMLNTIVNGFDSLTDTYQLEKIKTIGDAYFCVGGISGSLTSDHPERVLQFAMATFGVLREFNASSEMETQVEIRIGINTGGVVAGVIGKKKFTFDIWGDTINVASRMESTGVPGRIHISRSTYERVYDMGLEFEERKIEVKGKGECQTYLLAAKHHQQSIVTK